MTLVNLRPCECMPAIRVWRAASVQTGQSKANMAGKVGDQAETVKSPLAHRLDSAGTVALHANVRLISVPVRIRAEALQQEVDEGAYLRRQVPGRQVESVYVLLHGNVLG